MCLQTCQKQLFTAQKVLPPPRVVSGRLRPDTTRGGGRTFFLKYQKLTSLNTLFTSQGPRVVKPLLSPITTSPRSKIFLGETLDQPPFRLHNIVLNFYKTKFDQIWSKTVLAYHVSTFTKTSLITESDQTLSFLIKTWCDLNFFSSGPSLIH